MEKKNCLCGNGCMDLTRRKKDTTFKGVSICIESDAFVCPHCGLEAGSYEQASLIQKQIVDLYRKEKGLLTGCEIAGLRAQCNMSVQTLAELMSVDPAVVEGWETAQIQSPDQDVRLRRCLQP